MTSSLTVLSHHTTDGVRGIEPELLYQELRSGRAIVLVDVRAEREIEGRAGAGHVDLVDRARRIPLHDLVGRCHELAGLEHEPIVTLSRTGLRARAAAYALALAGFEDVTALEGGLVRWVELGFRVDV